MARKPRYFVHYWRGGNLNIGEEKYAGTPCQHTAGELFHKRRVSQGDFVYVWSYRDGELFLIGKMRVGRFISQREADALYRPEGLTAWKASEHILAEPGTGTPERYDLVVSPGIIRELRFLGQGRVSTVKYRGTGQIDPQTFRGLRELTPESARLLDNLLGSNNGKIPVSKATGRGQRHGGGFGTPESNAEVEAAAIKVASSWYWNRGWDVKSVEADRCGFDLRCHKDGAVQEVEVKGITGSSDGFVLTSGELGQAKTNPRFVLCVVTRATSARPILTRYSGKECMREFRFTPIQFRATRLKPETE